MSRLGRKKIVSVSKNDFFPPKCAFAVMYNVLICAFWKGNSITCIDLKPLIHGNMKVNRSWPHEAIVWRDNVSPSSSSSPSQSSSSSSSVAMNRLLNANISHPFRKVSVQTFAPKMHLRVVGLG